MTETLTKSEQNHQDNLHRRDEKRKREQKKREQAEERDAAIRQINAIYLPQINTLKDEHRKAMKEVWANWREQRSKE